MLLPLIYYTLYPKVSFSPVHPGSYSGSLHIAPSLSSQPPSLVPIHAIAESPNIQVITDPPDGGGLDYGIVASGSSKVLPLYLVNHGTSTVPLSLTMSTVSTLGTVYVYMYAWYIHVVLYSQLSPAYPLPRFMLKDCSNLDNRCTVSFIVRNYMHRSFNMPTRLSQPCHNVVQTLLM